MVGTFYVNASNELSFFTTDPISVTATHRFTTSTSGLITDVIAATAIPGIPQKWAVVTVDSNNLYQLWISDDGDFTNFTVHRTADGDNPAQGAMTNMIPV